MLDLFKATYGKIKMREHNMVDAADNLVTASFAHAIVQGADGWYLRLRTDERKEEFIADGWTEVSSSETPWAT